MAGPTSAMESRLLNGRCARRNAPLAPPAPFLRQGALTGDERLQVRREEAVQVGARLVRLGRAADRLA